MPYRKSHEPLPVPTPVTQPFWDGTKAHKLLLQRCKLNWRTALLGPIA